METEKAKKYLTMCQDSYRHADGSICKARSPESCPFNKKIESAEKEITGNETASSQTSSPTSVNFGDAGSVDVASILKEVNKYAEEDDESYSAKDLEEYFRSTSDWRSQSGRKRLRKYLEGVKTGSKDSVDHFRNEGNYHFYDKYRDLVGHLFSVAFDKLNNPQRSAAKRTRTFNDDAINNPSHPDYNPFYGM